MALVFKKKTSIVEEQHLAPLIGHLCELDFMDPLIITKTAADSEQKW